LSKIARSCDDILIVDHVDPCDATPEARRSLQLVDPAEPLPLPEKWTPPAPQEDCRFQKLYLGMFKYEGISGDNILLMMSTPSVKVTRSRDHSKAFGMTLKTFLVVLGGPPRLSRSWQPSLAVYACSLRGHPPPLPTNPISGKL
jgi:hypothetical protein